MAKKWVTWLQATVLDGAVSVSSYKSTLGFDEDTAARYQTLRVYRKEEEGFTYGKDYAEYFDGLRYEDAELIFQGALKASNQRRFTYVDCDVEQGSTYAYWMGDAEGEPAGPQAVKIRDPELYWSEEVLRGKVIELKDRFPDQVYVEAIGRTVQGRAIPSLRIGQADRCLAVVGYVHAGESGTELIMPVLERLLTETPDVLTQIAVLAIPCVNLDERERLVQGVPWYLRTNANGVDLNRNFPADWDTVDYAYGMISSERGSPTYRGPFAASEPETNAVMQCLQTHRPECVYAFHCLASLCGPCFITAKCAEDDKAFAEKFRQLVEPYGTGMAPDFTTEGNLHFACSSGSLPAWCYRQLGVPATDLEITDIGPEADVRLACLTDRTDRIMLEEYRNKHFAGVSAAIKHLAGQQCSGDHR